MNPEIEAKVLELKELLQDEGYRERLHPIEQIIAGSVVEDGRHLKCASCLRWINALIAKMLDYEDYSQIPSTLRKSHADTEEYEDGRDEVD